MRLAFTNARLVCPVGGVTDGTLFVENGLIRAPSPFASSEVERPVPDNRVSTSLDTNGLEGAGWQVIDCRDKTLAPGIVDLGVFAIDRAAFRAGGIVRVGLMPDQSPVLDDPGIVQRASLVGKPKLWIHPIAAATKGLAGVDLAEMAIMKDAGAEAVSTGRRWIADSGVMRKVLAYARDLELAVITHAEDGGLANGKVATEGETATRLGLRAAPAIAEALAIARDVALAEETGARLHVRQVTTAAGFDLIRAAKRRSVRVTCGITPTHLLLSDNAMSDFRTFAHLSPPLREESDRQAALAAMKDGTVDVLCSGHDPRGPEEKRLPFADAAEGASGAETLLALGLSLDLPIERLFALLAANPAKVIGLDTGTLVPGQPADLLLFDEHAPWQIRGDDFAARAGNTPFDGLPAQGTVLRLWKGGTEIPA